VISGGTDFASAFLGGTPELPTVPGEMQARCLGADVEAWDEPGRPLVDAVGELVCKQPMPSMPLCFWNDVDGRRYRDSYFDTYPNVWRHGDWLRITPSGGAVVYGRSDATLNRHGHRLGTAEMYRVVEALPEVLDSLVIDIEFLGRPSFMPLFVVLRPGLTLDDGLRERIRVAIRSGLSPRFLPDAIEQVAEVPRTLTGKKQELPVKKLMLGPPSPTAHSRPAPSGRRFDVELPGLEADEALCLGTHSAAQGGLWLDVQLARGERESWWLPASSVPHLHWRARSTAPRPPAPTTPAQLWEALDRAPATRAPHFGQALVDAGLVAPAELSQALFAQSAADRQGPARTRRWANGWCSPRCSRIRSCVPPAASGWACRWSTSSASRSSPRRCGASREPWPSVVRRCRWPAATRCWRWRWPTPGTSR
jgi:hypothetical protein